MIDSERRDPDQLFRAGRLSDSLEAQRDVVRNAPTDVGARVFLFALLSFSGEFERAGLALNAIGAQAGKVEVETATLRSLLVAEAERTEVLTRQGVPLLPPDPPAHVRARLRALTALRAGDLALAAKALDEAAAQTPAFHVTIDGVEAEALRDDDDLLGSVLEGFAGGRYLWLPFESIRSIELTPPKRTLDLLWAPARLETDTGLQASVFVPVLYQGSSAHPEAAVRLGRSTQWTDTGEDIYRGAGQRVFRSQHAGAQTEWPLLEIRSWTHGPRNGSPSPGHGARSREDASE